MIADLCDYAVAFDLAREAAVEGCPVSLIATRVRTLILSTTPADLCGSHRIDAIARGVADALAGNAPLIAALRPPTGDDDR
jgi:hypothetical protein